LSKEVINKILEEIGLESLNRHEQGEGEGKKDVTTKIPRERNTEGSVP